MCGRYTLNELTWREIHDLMAYGKRPQRWIDEENAARAASPIRPSYNVAPTHQVPIVKILLKGGDDLEPAHARWGLIPGWFRRPIREWKASTINARVETVAEAPSFRDAYKTRRCVMPMAGYYEWSTLKSPKRPFYVSPSGNEAGLMALGLWSDVQIPDYTGLTCTMLTEPAVGRVAELHDRQPVLVDAEGAQMWLDGALIEEIPRLDPAKLKIVRVAKDVGKVSINEPWLINPVSDDAP